MLYEARLVSDHFEEDPNKMGYIRVLFDRKIRWARPLYPFGEIKIPTKEWIDKYAVKDKIGVYCQEVNNQSYLVWTGFVVYKNQLPEEAMVNYAYRRVHFFSESWKIYSDDKVKQQLYTIEHTDGSKFTIDRTNGAEKIEFVDGISGHYLLMNGTSISLVDGVTGSKLELTAAGLTATDGVTSGNILEMTAAGTKINGDFVVLKAFLDWMDTYKSSFGLGNLGSPVPIFPAALTAFVTQLALPNTFSSKAT